jgi:hypothetical protein
MKIVGGVSVRDFRSNSKTESPLMCLEEGWIGDSEI